MCCSTFGSVSHSRVSQMAGKNSDETNLYNADAYRYGLHSHICTQIRAPIKYLPLGSLNKNNIARLQTQKMTQLQIQAKTGREKEFESALQKLRGKDVNISQEATEIQVLISVFSIIYHSPEREYIRVFTK